MLQPKKRTLILSAVLAIIIATLGRLIPHLDNATPLASLAILSGTLYNKKIGFILITLSLMLSDLLLSWLHGYSIFGTWSIFTYSGFWMMSLFAPNIESKQRYTKLTLYTVSVTLLFWLWTNFGTWLLSGLYATTLQGLNQCFIMGLPFLRHAILGNLGYMALFVLALQPVVNRVVHNP